MENRDVALSRPFLPSPEGQTVLGSFLQFAGAVCCSFNVIADESGMPALAQAEGLVDSWRGFFESTGIPAPLDQLKTSLRLVRESGIERARTLAEFNALFRAPALPAPLWESVWVSEEGILFTEETCAVRAWYARYHWEIHKAGYEAEDHIGFETAFCGWLFDAAVANQDLEQDGEVPQPSLADVRTFLGDHFSRWAPQCFAQLALAAETPFWTHLLTSASLLATALAEES